MTTSLLEEIPRRPQWFNDAACLGVGSDLFFPVREDDNGEGAMKICRTCPVQAECLAYGLRERHGIWGGLAYRQRRMLARKGRLPLPPGRPPSMRVTKQKTTLT